LKYPSEKIDLKNLSPSELTEFLGSFGKERYRSIQILRWLYQKGVHSIDEMTNLSKRFRQELIQVSFISTLHLLQVEESEDGTKKFLFQLEDENRIESVLIPDKYRLTLCVSTQVGCPLGCLFCATGQQGFERNLRPGEIIEQVLYFMRLVSAEQHSGETAADSARRLVTNVVFMGMGEPLSNYEAVWQAVEMLNSRRGLGLGARQLTISSVGWCPRLSALIATSSLPFPVNIMNGTLFPLLLRVRRRSRPSA
jgi:23S rRNA (adenine2503-C2)-methyltransferase